MNMQNQIDEEEKPLDPALENVQRKLKRFGALFMGFNFLALVAVFAALIYKLGGFGTSEEDNSQMPANMSAAIPSGFESAIDLPEGTKLLSSSLSGNVLVLTLQLADGQQAIWLYDLAAKSLKGRVKLH